MMNMAGLDKNLLLADRSVGLKRVKLPTGGFGELIQGAGHEGGSAAYWGTWWTDLRCWT